MASGFLMVALLQEAEGLYSAPDTLNRMLAALRTVDPDPMVMGNTIAGGLFRLTLRAHLFFDFPQTLTRAKGMVDDLRSAAGTGALTLENVQIKAHSAKDRYLWLQVKHAPAERVPLFANLPTDPDYHRPRRLRMISAVGPHGLLQKAIALFDQKNAFASAEAYAAAWGNPTGRAIGFALIACDLARMGRYQVSIGDGDAALETLERVQAMGTKLPLQNDFCTSLAPLLAAKGRYLEAVEMAAALDCEITTASVATLID